MAEMLSRIGDLKKELYYLTHWGKRQADAYELYESYWNTLPNFHLRREGPGDFRQTVYFRVQPALIDDTAHLYRFSAGEMGYIEVDREKRQRRNKVNRVKVVLDYHEENNSPRTFVRTNESNSPNAARNLRRAREVLEDLIISVPLDNQNPSGVKR